MIAAASLAPTLTSCDSDYLERAPITYPSDSQILATTSAAQRGAWGICRSMYFMYGVADQIQFFIGEPFINTVYGDLYAPKPTPNSTRRLAATVRITFHAAVGICTRDFHSRGTPPQTTTLLLLSL